MTACFTCFVPGSPASQGGTVPFKHKSGNTNIQVTKGSKGLGSWRKECTRVFKLSRNSQGVFEAMDGPLKTHLIFVMPRLKKHDKGATLWAETALDADKLERAVNDSLTKAEVIKNDARICFTIRIKRHCQSHETPGVIVRVSKLPKEYDLAEMESAPGAAARNER